MGSGPSKEVTRDAALGDVGAVGAEEAEPLPPRLEPPIGKRLGEDLIVAENVTREFSLRGRSEMIVALRDISLSPRSPIYPIRRGEFVMIRGSSGGGKTTLLNLIGLLDRPSAGFLSVVGLQLGSGVSDSELAGVRLRKIGCVFQTFNLMSAMSAAENVELPMLILGKLSASARRQRATSLLQSVGLADRLEHLPSELSGGEQQRVALARAMANEPEIMLLDEPTGDLDVASSTEVMRLVLDINLHRGTTVVMVTHNPDLECYADRILYVEDGRFTRQVFNARQVALEADEYATFLRSVERTAEQREVPKAALPNAAAAAAGSIPDASNPKLVAVSQ